MLSPYDWAKIKAIVNAAMVFFVATFVLKIAYDLWPGISEALGY
jgi:hypothetical protein